MAKSPLLRPYLKWAGGKRQLLPEIQRRLPPNMNQLTYYEPFVGAGAVLFDLAPSDAVINDSNEQLILTYRVVRENVEELIRLLMLHKSQHCEEYFYIMRNADRLPSFAAWSDEQKAARLIYLNKTCFNGLYRVNAQGLFNVPFGRYINPSICEEGVLHAVSAYFNRTNIQILDGDFELAVNNADHHSFVYFDPPYHSPGHTNFTGYQADKFDDNEQIRLRDLFLRLTQSGVFCMLSNSDTAFIRHLYDNPLFHIDTIQARRTINADTAGRGNVNEVLITNW